MTPAMIGVLDTELDEVVPFPGVGEPTLGVAGGFGAGSSVVEEAP